MSRIIAALVACSGLALLVGVWIWNRSVAPDHPPEPQTAPVQQPPRRAVALESLPDVPAAANILEAIAQLESARDPKCHSTACRFENFLFGTPLSDEAREEKVAQQKRLIRTIWQEAGAAAERDGEAVISVSHLQPLIDQVTASLETVTVEADDATDDDTQFIVLSPVRNRQYASIAYSLRAILGAHQDSLVEGGSPLRELDAQSLESLRDAVDAVSLRALRIADRNARTSSQPQVSRDAMRDAWESLLPESISGEPIEGMAHGESPQPTSEQALSVLGAVISGKLSSYQSYNEVDPQQAGNVFLENVTTYYALYPLMLSPSSAYGARQATSASDQHNMMSVLAAHKDAMIKFTRQVLQGAQQQAEENGHSLIRAEDAVWAIDQATPHRIDALEDVHFFHNLESEEAVTLESYDCDSFRDFGLHWQTLQEALELAPALSVVPDPFAAEIIAEAISQYGVLLFRLAGRHALSHHAAPTLTPADIEQARLAVQQRAEQHHSTAPDTHAEPGFLSATPAETDQQQEAFFSEVSGGSGVDFHHRSSVWLSEFRRTRTQTLPTFSGGGVAAEDVNNDSHLDLLFVGGAGNALYLGDGTGKFSDVTETAGLIFTDSDGQTSESRQPLIVDFDNDGLQDILITSANAAHRLYKNLDGDRFEDVTGGAGLGGEELIGGPATVFDFDGDGLLDVYIGYFGNYLLNHAPRMNRDNTNALPNKLFRNLGQLRFEEVADSPDLADSGWTQAVSHTDFDQDGRQDIIVANDFGRNAFLRNLGDGRFEDRAAPLGITNAFHSMNVGVTDLNGDGFPEVYISNIATLVKDNKYVLPDVETELNFDLRAMAGMLVSESDVLYVSEAQQGRLAAYRPSTNIERGPTSTGWAWDAEFFDFDNDGDDDLYVVNGANDYNLLYTMFAAVDDQGKQSVYHLNHNRESNVFFVNSGGKLKNVSSQSGADFVGNSRSTAYLDWDNDGDLDVAVNNFHAPATMLRNNSESQGRNWIKVRLIGDVAGGSNRDALGARIIATTSGGLRAWREIQGGSGYLSMNPKTQHIGLGDAESVDLEITWPNGQRQQVADLHANRLHTIEQSATTE